MFLSFLPHSFGCGRTGPRTGLLFNTALDDFTSAPDDSAAPAATTHNLRRPHKRPLSSMAPLIVTERRTGAVRCVAGASGGSQIPTALAGFLVRLFARRQSLKQAVDAPRVHSEPSAQGRDGRQQLQYEYGVREQVLQVLSEQFGHELRRYGRRGSIVTALWRNATGVWGVADYRKRGEVVGF